MHLCVNGSMKKVLYLAALIWIVSGQVPTVEERTRIMELLTEVRESVDPPASNMMMLTYSSELESIAKDWIANCSVLAPDPRYLPENVSATQSFDYVFRPSFESMVTATATAVGCSQRHCFNRTEHLPAMYYTTCLYKPVKIIITERPYNQGNSCSACPESFTCQRKQCVNISSVVTTSPSTTTSSSATLSPIILVNFSILLLCFITQSLCLR
uniref:SCP domain-containing protein n=1 Tax=Mesocestoides corti TaxID=53468 RepID=A0A5K3FIN4_MESCO